MSSSAPAVRSSGSGPDGIGDTTLFIATAASHASDGPTLPVIGGVGEHADLIRPRKNNGDARPAKKRKTDNDTATEPVAPASAPKKPQVDLAPLYKPWTLLPPGLLQQVKKTRSGTWDETVEVVVFTKNQNVKSGINRLKALLGFADARLPGEERVDEAKGGNEGGLIAVSGYSEGTTKMVGIVEMTKRVVSSGNGKKDADKESWYAYTTLTGLAMPMQQQEEHTEGGQDAEEQGNKTIPQGVKTNVPVLTVWFSRGRIPGFKAAFGEQTFTVHHPSDA